ncbi:hypothetical protein IEO21_05262 [Rhodonia placenta]|uniref:Uncharacterized protein n=1 Tax=Rhodonia placenta TaxID=104341 RepID=A0A8H7P2L8_9APHY|nr:hypothetical protein IEO21_05262 [Postia placenta]
MARRAHVPRRRGLCPRDRLRRRGAGDDPERQEPHELPRPVPRGRRVRRVPRGDADGRALPHAAARGGRGDVRAADAAHRAEREAQDVLARADQDLGHPHGSAARGAPAPRQDGGGLREHGHLDPAAGGHRAPAGPRAGPVQERAADRVALGVALMVIVCVCSRAWS